MDVNVLYRGTPFFDWASFAPRHKRAKYFFDYPVDFFHFFGMQLCLTLQGRKNIGRPNQHQEPPFLPPSFFVRSIRAYVLSDSVRERGRECVCYVCVCVIVLGECSCFSSFSDFPFPSFLRFSLSFTLCHSDGPEEKKFVGRKVCPRERSFQLWQTFILSAGHPLDILYYKTRNGAAYNGPHAVAGEKERPYHSYLLQETKFHQTDGHPPPPPRRLPCLAVMVRASKSLCTTLLCNAGSKNGP